MKTTQTCIAALVGALLLGAGTARAENEMAELENMQSFIELLRSYVEFNHMWLELIGD